MISLVDNPVSEQEKGKQILTLIPCIYNMLHSERLFCVMNLFGIFIKGELNPKIKSVLFEKTLKIKE